MTYHTCSVGRTGIARQAARPSSGGDVKATRKVSHRASH